MPDAIPADFFPAETEFALPNTRDTSFFALSRRGTVYGWGAFLVDKRL
jgi:hypothetical protein